MYRPGLTLVEVLASLVIIGGSVAAILVAQSNCLQHIEASRLQLTARDIATELIAAWRLNGSDLSMDTRGEVEGMTGWAWRRSSQPSDVLKSVKVTEVKLEIIHRDPHLPGAVWVRSYFWLSSNEQE